MGLFSLEKLFGITVRESANDGSDFTNPDADYRRLFLGEDGLLHVKDSAGAVTDIGGSGSGTPHGTSFPGGPTTYDHYIRDDLGLEFYWDGTRWLTTQLHDAQAGYYQVFNVSGGGGGTVAVTEGRFPMLGGTAIWIVDVCWAYQVNATHDASHYWTANITRQTTSGVLAALVTDKSTTTWNNPAPTAVGVLVPADETLIYCAWVPTGATGTLGAVVRMRYRIVST